MKCEPATTIIRKFNGLKAVAEITNVTPHSVMRWRRPRAEGGTGGAIPHWHVPKLLEAAGARDIDISPADFAPSRQEADAR